MIEHFLAQLLPLFRREHALKTHPSGTTRLKSARLELPLLKTRTARSWPLPFTSGLSPTRGI